MVLPLRKADDNNLAWHSHGKILLQINGVLHQANKNAIVLSFYYFPLQSNFKIIDDRNINVISQKIRRKNNFKLHSKSSSCFITAGGTTFLS